MKEFSIDGRLVGERHTPLVIAEIGINHNGSLEIAKKMVDAALDAGIEVIKHQTHIIEDEMSKEALKVIPGNSDKSIHQIMSECALNEADELALKEYIESRGAIFISTPFSRAASDRLERMNVSAYKIGSGECNNYPLIEHIAAFGKPIILSTGMNGIQDIQKAVNIFKSFDIPFALLHTTNIYPTPDHLVRLGAMTELSQSFPDAIVGLSDHTITNHSSFGAIALGASIIERHFTDSMKRDGPDISCSMDPASAKDLLDGIDILFKQRGGSKGPVKEEQATIDFAFATVVTIKEIKKGEVFSKDNLWVKRPGTGEIKAEFLSDLFGKRSNANISQDVHLNWNHIEK
tara:strand:+ start:1639 stop:2679 length:1041 start_codon:yes stop_codon:yes gene_type:complete